MRIGVYSNSLPKLSRLRALRLVRGARRHRHRARRRRLGPWPRPHLDLATIGTAAERDRLTGELKEHGLRLGAVNAAGNLLHPDPAKREDAQARFKAAVALAVALGVKRVVTMSGCPAGPGGGGLGVFPCWATSCDDENLFQWQIAQRARTVLAGNERLAGRRSAGRHGLPGAASGRFDLQRRRLRGARRAYRQEHRPELRPEPFLVAGDRSRHAGRGVRRAHRLGARQGHAALSRAHPARRRAALRAAPIRHARRGISRRSGRGTMTRHGRLCSARCVPPAMTMSSRSSTRIPATTDRRGPSARSPGSGVRSQSGGRVVTTLVDVARRAGVSKSTVSNVIHGATLVAEATRQSGGARHRGDRLSSERDRPVAEITHEHGDRRHRSRPQEPVPRASWRSVSSRLRTRSAISCSPPTPSARPPPRRRRRAR